MTQYLRVPSGKIEIQRYPGRHKDCPCLVFLHEGLGCIDMWKDFPARVSQKTGCPALVYSRLGYGRSDSCPLPRKITFMHREALDILPEIIRNEQIRDYVLIGHSDGGSIGIIFSGGRRSRGLKGLVTLAAHVFCEPVSVDSIFRAKHKYEQSRLKQALERYHGGNTDTAFYGWNDTWLNPAFRHWNIEKYLKKIRVPMLALQGKEDPYGTAEQISAIQKQVPRIETCLIPDCRHAPHFEQPGLTLDLVVNFIRKLSFVFIFLHSLPDVALLKLQLMFSLTRL